MRAGRIRFVASRHLGAADVHKHKRCNRGDRLSLKLKMCLIHLLVEQFVCFKNKRFTTRLVILNYTHCYIGSLHVINRAETIEIKGSLSNEWVCQL